MRWPDPITIRCTAPMSVQGQERTFTALNLKSALPSIPIVKRLKADISNLTSGFEGNPVVI